VVALPAPTERERSQMYVQRYIPHLPAAGEVVVFDRSWYHRAGVERVMGFTPEEHVERFLAMTPAVERWDDYSRARDDMICATDSSDAPLVAALIVRSR